MPVAREILAYVRVSPNPEHLSLLEAMKTLHSWKQYSPLQVCRAKRDGIVHMITNWGLLDPGERARMVASVATTDDHNLDCVAILTQNPEYPDAEGRDMVEADARRLSPPRTEPSRAMTGAATASARSLAFCSMTRAVAVYAPRKVPLSLDGIG